ncbi:S-formylglutathione hydrolase FrmB [Arthrobacter stackebrandtii]|uniref:S-formylglutathione hydrolase FrmB n=1 Tax=Arthrobacter stackebrandtii TaxID=272161 RepID=A0ABS4YYU1_9MICC|nr:S-formylglutathione hydrolase FrmB [Arthrobacter stackebrandtii]PYH00467.1 esterase [Arthrobacter stackebrandtii]
MLRRSRRWWLFAAAAAAASALLSIAACWAAIHVVYLFAEDLPATVVINLALVLWVLTLGCATALGGLRWRRTPGPSPARRMLAVVATVAVLATAGVQVNAYFGEYPTVGSLLGEQPVASHRPPPALQQPARNRFMASAVAAGWHAPSGLPQNGTLLAAQIPGTVSGFHGRDAVVYLPPAYYAPNRPVLPVLVLVSGQPGSPESWLRSTKLSYDLDAFAAAHEGLAPIVVIPDPNGSNQNNTMCMDSKLANAGTYMAQDVPAWIKSHLDADTNPAHWAIGGFSYGGTCSVQMVTRHPDVYESFMAISPEREPALAAKRSVTVDRAFHGDGAAFVSQLPLTLMAKHDYPAIHGWFAAGSQDATYSANVRVLMKAGEKAGMSVESQSFPGGHSWAVANKALKPGLNFVYGRLGLI